MKTERLYAGIRNGVLVGNATAKEWGSIIGISPETVRKNARIGRMYKGTWFFEKTDKDGNRIHAKKPETEPPVHVKPMMDLFEKAGEAHEKHISYGQLVAQKYAEQIKIKRRKGLTSMRERECEKRRD